MKMMADTKTFSCIYCKKGTKSSLSLNKHISIYHKEEHTAATKTEACPYCNFLSVNKRALRFHVNQKHKEEHKNATKTEICQYCKAATKNKMSLRRHISRRHKDEHKHELSTIRNCTNCSSSFDTLKALKIHILEIHRKHLSEKFSCNITECGFECSTMEGLNMHTRLCHPLSKYMCQEKACEFSTSKLKDLRFHLNNTHFMGIEVSMYCFKNLDYFEEWLTIVEKGFHCQFVVDRTDGKYEKHYGCNRSGLHIRSGLEKRKMKSQGSCKSGSYCTAYIKRSILPDESVVAETCLFHYGHGLDFIHMRLQREDKLKIQEKLLSGNSIDRILEDLNFEMKHTANENLQRKHFVKKVDLYNIKKALDNPNLHLKGWQRIQSVNDVEVLERDNTFHITSMTDFQRLQYKISSMLKLVAALQENCDVSIHDKKLKLTEIEFYIDKIIDLAKNPVVLETDTNMKQESYSEIISIFEVPETEKIELDSECFPVSINSKFGTNKYAKSVEEIVISSDVSDNTQ